MKIEVNENGNIQLEKVFNPIVLISDDKEKLIICMRDSGFEVQYKQSKDSPYERYEFKSGVVNGLQLPTVEQAGVIAVKIAETDEPILTGQEQAFFVAGFQECIKYLMQSNQKLNEAKGDLGVDGTLECVGDNSVLANR